MRALLRLIQRFARDRRGNIAITFGICSVPLLTAVGAGIDYSLATRMKAKLQSAADAAAVASISAKSPGFMAASAMQTDGSVAAGVADANNVFNGIMNTIQGYTNLQVTSVVTKTGIKINSSVTFSAQVPTTFMRLAGFTALTVNGVSSAGGSLPPYLDFYVTLDVSGSMGLPSTGAEATRFQNMNPDNYRQYPTGCTLACHFAAQNSACTDGGTQGYPTNNYCIGYAISRLSPSGFQGLLVNQSPANTYPWKNANNSNRSQQLPNSIATGAGTNALGVTYRSLGNNGLPGSLTQPTSIGGGGLSAVSSCPTVGTDNCIQLRLDAVGFALNATTAANGVDGMLALAQKKKVVTDQFRIGLYPFITSLYSTYSPLTTTIDASSTTPGTINYNAANLATLLDTNTNSSLGSGGTHIDTALISLNNLITSVGNGSNASFTQPYVFLVTDGAQDPQWKDVPNGSWHGSNHATTLDLQGTLAASAMTACTNLKNRGIIVSVLYIPYQTINPVNTSFAGNEDTFANTNIQYIANSLSKCASPPDGAGSYFYTANTPQDITDSLKAMFNHALVTAHITN
jgi:Flp pilus assembly protein TadG